MNIKSFKARFNPKGKKLKPGQKGAIRIEAYYSPEERIYLETEFSVPKQDWDTSKRCVRKTNQDALFINSKIKERISKLESYNYALMNQGQSLSPELLDDFVSRNFENHHGMTFTDYFDNQRKTREFNSKSTKQHHTKTFNKLKAFKKNVAFNELNVSFIEKFDSFLKEQGLMLNSRANHHKTLKANISLAATEGYIEHRKVPYATDLGGKAGKFHIKTEEGSIVFLDFEERENLEELSYPDNETYERYRKAFLFMCYTGLRISDIENFKPLHLQFNTRGYSISLHKMIKTRKPVYLELYKLFEGKPQVILKEFLMDSFGSDDFDYIMKNHPSDSVFKNCKGQVINRELKSIGGDAGIYKNLSNHVGRHTFGTQMAYLSNGNLNLVKDLMGHSKAETTMTYIKLAEKMRGQLLSKIDWKAHKETDGDEDSKTDKENPKPEVIEETPQNITSDKPGKPSSNVNAPEKSNLESINMDNIQARIKPLKGYIYSNVIRDSGLSINGTSHFCIPDESFGDYVKALPFSQKDFEHYQANPFTIQGYVDSPECIPHIDMIKKTINENAWIKGACLKIDVLFMPVLNEDDSVMI